MSEQARRVVARFQVQARYRPGDKVRILETHNFKHYHGDVGEIEKIIPINKAYVELEKNGRVIVDLDDVEPVQGKSAAISQEEILRYLPEGDAARVAARFEYFKRK